MRTDNISHLNFADDITFLSDDLSTAQELLSRVEAGCERTGLHQNTKETKTWQLI